MPRDGSIGAASVGAASLGARRDAPADHRAPSVRSDERPLATQGDMLNSIKFQRRFRDTDKISNMFQDKTTFPPKTNIRDVTSKTTTKTRPVLFHETSLAKERVSGGTSKNQFGPTRPSSPKPRRSTANTFSFY